MSSSSSSDTDEEEKQRLQESVNGFHIESEKQERKVKEKSTKKSLRQSENHEIRESVLNTTPEFRTFIAKKLDSYFEEIIKDKNIATAPEKETTEKESGDCDGIKLLWSSPVFLPDTESIDALKDDSSKLKIKKKKKYVSSSSSDDDEEMERLRSAAVTSDFVTGISSHAKNGEDASEHVTSKKPKKKKKKKAKVTEVD